MLSVCLSFFELKIGVSITQLQEQNKEKVLLTVAIHNMTANVQDRKWDTQGSVAIHSVTIQDYITTGTYALCLYWWSFGEG